MGLEYTEIMIACEEEFGINIADEENRLDTVGSLYHYILTSLSQHQGKCLKVSTFFRLRNALVRHTAHDKRSIRPDTRLVDILPALRRRRLWRAIENDTKLELPILPAILPVWLAVSVSIVLGIALAFALPLQFLTLLRFALQLPKSDTVASIFGVIMTVLVFALPCVFFVVLGYPSRVPKTWTVSHLVDLIIGARSGSVGPNGKPWNPSTVWIAMRDIIASTLDIQPEQVTPDAHFFKDLRAG